MGAPALHHHHTPRTSHAPHHPLATDMVHRTSSPAAAPYTTPLTTDSTTPSPRLASPRLTTRRKDLNSHFNLRLSHCQSEDQRRWFLAQEAFLFKYRLEQLSPQEVGGPHPLQPLTQTLTLTLIL